MMLQYCVTRLSLSSLSRSRSGPWREPGREALCLCVADNKPARCAIRAPNSSSSNIGQRPDRFLDGSERLSRDRQSRIRRERSRNRRPVDDDKSRMGGLRIRALFAAVEDLAKFVDDAFGHRRTDPTPTKGVRDDQRLRPENE